MCVCVCVCVCIWDVKGGREPISSLEPGFQAPVPPALSCLTLDLVEAQASCKEETGLKAKCPPGSGGGSRDPRGCLRAAGAGTAQGPSG